MRNNFSKKGRQNLTVKLEKEVIRKAKILAARHSTSISSLVSRHIEHLVSEDEAYQRAQRQALDVLDKGFHLGASHRIDRDELHER